MKPTVPAPSMPPPAEQSLPLPTPLALAALEAGVGIADVMAYVGSRFRGEVRSKIMI